MRPRPLAADTYDTENMLRRRHPNTMTLRRILPAALVFGAIITHLASEFFGMGARADGAILFSSRHAYLALAAIGCAVFIAFEIRTLLAGASGRLDLKRQLSDEVRALPLDGDWRFYGLVVGLQFALGVGSAVGEGCLFCGHDVVFGVVGALLVAALLALAGRLITARLPRLAAALAPRFAPRPEGEPKLRSQQQSERSPNPVFWSLQLANRPPPLLS